ncbi:MAG: DsrE family protein [Candidatus Eremiobacteraeota bacterium]|nr:DsrE family protein [Candidatus Eremiobacteraeota bacterium]MCW5870462.1 DsrE family protein [Candidatus Eremiobacteraeota bacterium]
MSRPVVVTLSNFSPSTPSLVAPLRVAIGLASAYRRQTVTVMLCDEGVLHALKERNPAWVDRYITSAKAHKVELWADQASLESLGVQADQLHASVQVKAGDEFWEVRSGSSLNLSF